MKLQTFLDTYKVFKRNNTRYAILYYLAKKAVKERDDYHAGRTHALMTSRMSVFRMNRIHLPDNDLFDFLIWCYFMNTVTYKVLSVYKKANIYTVEHFFKDDLITKLNNNELTKNIELNHLANCLMFQREAKGLYEIYNKQLSNVTVIKQILNERSCREQISINTYQGKYDIQKLNDELVDAQRACVTWYSGLLGASDRPRSST